MQAAEDHRRRQTVLVQTRHHRLLLQLLHERYKVFETQGHRARADLPESFHRTRIEFKKFRYTWEALAPLVPIPKSIETGLKAVQNILGEIQDSVVSITLFLEFLVDSRQTQPSAEFLQFLREAEQRQDADVANFICDRNLYFREVRPPMMAAHARAA